MSSSLLSILFSYGIPLFVAVFVSVFSVITLGLFMANARVAALLFFIVIISFVHPSYVVHEGFDVYAKGSRTFFFPIIQFYLYGLFLAILFQNTFEMRTVMKGAGKGWMLAFAALFSCHFAYGLGDGVSLAALLSERGLINVLHMSMIAYVAVSVIRDEKSLAWFTKTLLAIAVARGCYGLGRFLFFDGDPQNAYVKYGLTDLKITYWDINEGLIASMVVFYCGWRLFREWSTLSRGARTFFVVAAVVELLDILFSYRRAQQYGLLLAGLYFIWLLPKGKRAVAALTFVLLMLPAVGYLSSYRTQETFHQNNLSLIEQLAPDVATKGGITSRYARFYELSEALDTIAQSPLVGVGIWGEFDIGISSRGLEYHEGRYDLVHSGLGHVLLKSGIIGLIIFCGVLFSAWRFASRARSYVPEKHLGLFEACRAGLIFLVPSLLFGTPIPEFRSMALLGVILAVPISISIVARSHRSQLVGTSRPMTARAMRRSIQSSP
jgi:hypothetical protein